jgi:hypothetical protein
MKRTAVMLVTVAMALTATPALASPQSDVVELRKATRQFHKVSNAEAAGYGSTLDILGCFENPGVGGMGVHYVDFAIVDGTPEVTAPEALVYEMKPNGHLNLVGVEYLVPLDAWTEEEPPSLFGQHFHQHPVLPFWVLHVWAWRSNPAGMFTDWNPLVGNCPEGVPVFGVDLP